jgi:CRP-like cAMP-binding protein
MNSPSSPLPEIPAVGFLAEVSPEHRAFLTGFGKFHRRTNGEVFIHEGSPQESLSLVLVGKLHVLTSLTSNPLRLAELGEGDVIGEINLFDPATASATVVARDDCLIWSMSRDELKVLIEADCEAGHSVMWGLLRQLSRRIRQMNEKLVEASDLCAKLTSESTPYDDDD